MCYTTAEGFGMTVALAAYRQGKTKIHFQRRTES
jgi:hypothetical protein